jgi:hypothetical protein
MASLGFLTGDRDPEFGIQQPADVVTPLYTVTHVNGKAKLTWNKNFKAKKTEKYLNAQQWLDNAVLHDCEPYVPFRAGILIFSGITGTKIGSGRVSWIVPYARYQYYGKVMIPSPFGGGNILTKRNLKYHGGGKRGAFWFERAKEVRRDAWRKGVALIAAGRAA